MYGKCSFQFDLLVFCSLSMFASDFLSADEFDRFATMSNRERTAHLTQVFEKRMKHADNLAYTLESSMGYRKFKEPNTDVVVSRKVIEHKILKDSYTMQIDAPPDVRGGGYHQLISIFSDGKEGVTKNYLNSPPDTGDAFWGRIDTKEDPITRENYYTAWLNDNFNYGYSPQPTGDYFLFPGLLRYKDHWKIAVDSIERVVKLSSPYPQVFIADEFVGIRKLTLDPEKGFMPLIEEYRWDAKFQNTNDWYEGGFFVEDSVLVGDVWMPVKVTSYFRTPSHQENEVLIKMNIAEMKQGQVSKSDMSLKFPEGTSVVDAINGIAYKTDARGNPIQSTIEPLYGLDPSQVKMPEPPKSTINMVLMTIGIVMILIGLYIAVMKRLRKSS